VKPEISEQGLQDRELTLILFFYTEKAFDKAKLSNVCNAVKSKGWFIANCTTSACLDSDRLNRDNERAAYKAVIDKLLGRLD